MTMHGEREGLPAGWFTSPNVARIENHLVGETDNYACDRAATELLLQEAPWLPQMVRENKEYGPRAVITMAQDLGIRQFLDLGCGLPTYDRDERGRYTPARTHEAASSVHDDTRVIYVDDDPMVCSHARMVLEEDSNVRSVEADVRNMDDLLAGPGLDYFDRDQPIAVLAHDLLPWMSLEAADAVMTTLRRRLPVGSAISITHATTDMAPQTMQALGECYAASGIAYQPRSLEQIQALLGSWSLVPPGIVPTAQWRAPSALQPDRRFRQMAPADFSFAYAALATAAPSTPSAGR
ncbi:SAM-dependent methyltransferase [Streptomyces sp. NPDC015125]|uniref:SAM-dependent methyltransferase n=1 Tax=Streptomyces sp. NPDC015125 TaxID=3364938 RepID=UPI0036FF89B6